MAVLARLREACLHVIRVGRCLVILQMAGDACGIGQVVVSVDVALRARGGHVHSAQRETGLAVIECRVRPRRGVVASGAGRGNSGLHVVRVGRALVILLMAGDA